ncbi:MAG: hypothetical protein A3H97_21925 [Acidobacteria bacterium RIFCSPLOWO2_02_FULL_65_29]|nr:MAG: hypothetical protein A3H97_21925 [Acidobacteria bacterium RIFCSPLOWO2_02_FULL_65_29]
MAGAAILAAFVRPSLFRPPHRLVDASIVACLLVTGAQLIPLPLAVRAAISPAAAEVERQLLFDAGASTRPLSLDAASTLWALASGTAMALIFWSARSVFARGAGLRVVARWTAWFGLALAAVMFVQRAATPGLIYGFWTPMTRASHPTPLGPFVNRNDIATWLMLACPLVVGYLMARWSSRVARPGGRRNIETFVDSRALWLGMSACLMIAALLASLSRSGLFGAAVAVCVFALLARRRVSGRRLGWSLAAVGLAVAVATMYVNLDALAQRISDTLPSNLGGRLAVWRETWPMARDFPLTGIGVGAFERGMLVYQQSTRLIFFNHAHNEYLQVLVEGGWLLAAPAAIAIVVGWWGVRARLGSDRTPMFWVRVGAASGLAAVAAQSLWDTGLRMPASAVLFAIVAAAALHDDPAPDIF